MFLFYILNDCEIIINWIEKIIKGFKNDAVLRFVVEVWRAPANWVESILAVVGNIVAVGGSLVAVGGNIVAVGVEAVVFKEIVHKLHEYGQ